MAGHGAHGGPGELQARLGHRGYPRTHLRHHGTRGLVSQRQSRMGRRLLSNLTRRKSV